jgi:hypothetical protein
MTDDVPPPKKPWFIYWLVVFGVLAFAVPEAVALADPDQGDTLSESVRWLTNTPIGFIGFIAFIGWFTWHILVQRGKKGDDE